MLGLKLNHVSKKGPRWQHGGNRWISWASFQNDFTRKLNQMTYSVIFYFKFQADILCVYNDGSIVPWAIVSCDPKHVFLTNIIWYHLIFARFWVQLTSYRGWMYPDQWHSRLTNLYQCSKYALLNLVIIGLYNGLSPVAPFINMI